ncbi:Porin [Vibrio crassostreae]|nr:Porin [Vibrio crassostreae]CAK3545424.1 Porin [Vibrio crassostreae]CAK3634207.1 Porin [Vibrio crassostreae]CAK3655737.1 Porin [Vibrio crassostreae]CAK3659543.1 Porin [Vibrio crassostreae]
MNKKLLALAISGAVFGTQAVAVELYNEDGTTFSVGGHVSVAVGDVNSDDRINEDDIGVETVSPRINFGATHDLGNGFTADAKGEWALNMLDGGDQSFTTRLGYVGLSHDDFGRAAVGTQWAPYYSVAGVADMPIAFANDFIYEDHGNLGTGRAEEMVSYGNAIDFGNAGSLGLGVAWQGRKASEVKYSDTLTTDNKYGNRAQIALNYSIAEVTANYAYNTGDVTYSNLSGSKTADSHVLSATYGSYGSEGLYLAGVYAMNNYMNSATGKVGSLGVTRVLEESVAIELLASYALSNSLNLSINYEAVEDEKLNETVYSTTALQAEYNFTSQFVGFAGYQFDLQGSGLYKNDADDQWLLGARYYL